MKIISKMFLVTLLVISIFVFNSETLGAYWNYGGNSIDFFTSIYQKSGYYFTAGSFTDSRTDDLIIRFLKINSNGQVLTYNEINGTGNDSCAFMFQDESGNFVMGGNNSYNTPILAVKKANGTLITHLRIPEEGEEDDQGGTTGNNGTEEEEEFYVFVGSRKLTKGTRNIILFATDIDLESDGMPEIIIETTTDDHGYGIISLDSELYPDQYIIVGCRGSNQYIAKISLYQDLIIKDTLLNVGKLYSIIDGRNGYAYICGYEQSPTTGLKQLVLLKYDLSNDSINTYYPPITLGFNTIGYEIKKDINYIYIVGDEIISSNNSAIVEMFDLTGNHIHTYKFDQTEITNGRGIGFLADEIYICGNINITTENSDAYIDFTDRVFEEKGGESNQSMNPESVLLNRGIVPILVNSLSSLISNQNIELHFEVFQKQNIQIKVFDITGSEICCLADQVYNQGTYTITWERIDNQQKLINAGIYFIQLVTDYQTLSEKVIFTQ